MKKIVLMITMIFALTGVFADTIYFKDGNTMTGEILKTTDTVIIVFTPLGTMTISKDTVERVVGESKATNSVSRIDITTKDPLKYDPDLRASKKMFGLALAFFVPGNIMFFGTLAIGTPFVIQYYSSPVYNYNGDGSRNSLGGASYASLIVTSLLLNAVSIPFFVSSNHYSKLFKKRNNMALISGFDGERLSFGLKLSL